jgi:hypothetical protein
MRRLGRKLLRACAPSLQSIRLIRLPFSMRSRKSVKRSSKRCKRSSLSTLRLSLLRPQVAIVGVPGALKAKGPLDSSPFGVELIQFRQLSLLCYADDKLGRQHQRNP